MRGSSTLFRQRTFYKFCRRASPVLLLLFSTLSILFVPLGTRSHEPITTKIRFNKEIVRIFQRHCLACHNSGSTTNILLDTFPRARPWAKSFKEEVLEKRMPPYQAVKGFGTFHNDYALTQLEIDQIVSWVEGGVPKGDEKDLPPPTTAAENWELGKPDLIITNQGANIPAGDGDESRCFVLPTNLKTARWVNAVDFQPGDRSTVHCAEFAIDRSHAHKARNGTSNCDTSTTDTLGIWVPGQSVTRLPANVARLLSAGARILLRVHYRKMSKPVNVKSSVGLYFTNGRALKPLNTLVLAAPEEEIRAGVESHRLKATYTTRESLEAIRIRPRLFPFAKSVEVKAYRPNGTIEVLVWAKDYRYDWQPQYEFKNPVLLPRGSRIEAVAYIDNSDNNPNNPNHPAQAVRFAAAVCELSFIRSR